MVEVFRHVAVSRRTSFHLQKPPRAACPFTFCFCVVAWVQNPLPNVLLLFARCQQSCRARYRTRRSICFERISKIMYFEIDSSQTSSYACVFKSSPFGHPVVRELWTAYSKKSVADRFDEPYILLIGILRSVALKQVQRPACPQTTKTARQLTLFPAGERLSLPLRVVSNETGIDFFCVSSDLLPKLRNLWRPNSEKDVSIRC